MKQYNSIIDAAIDVPENFYENKKEMIEISKMKNEIVESFKNTPKVKKAKIGRNDPCPCGSGKKYKNCCLNTGKYENYE